MLANGALSTSGRLAHILTDGGMMARRICPKCLGTGLGGQAAHTTFHGKTITELENMYIRDLYDFFADCDDARNPLLGDLRLKLSCMIEVGLFHLALSCPLPTLSGGEIQRLFLASYIITEMDSIIFLFDEPTIGLHETEKENLIRIIRRLVENGNTVVAVEHDKNFMCAADYIIDIGPDAGTRGGMKMYEGGFTGFLKCRDSRTAPWDYGGNCRSLWQRQIEPDFRYPCAEAEGNTEIKMCHGRGEPERAELRGQRHPFPGCRSRA